MTPTTRDRLIQAASELLWERSYFATGVEEVCARAGARKGSFYHFFPSKTELAITAIRARWDYVRGHVFDAISASGPAGLDRLRRLTDFLAAEQDRSVQFFHLVLGSPFGNVGQETGHQDERIRTTVNEVFDSQIGYIARWLEEAVERGEILEGDNQQRARNVLALLEGALLMAKVGDNVDLFVSVAASVPVVASAL
ncbi:MAG: TetR/AcrR family transcriptional regulator [Vicinamibacterales bacterium]